MSRGGALSLGMFLAGILGCCVHSCGPARAGELGELACLAQDAIRLRARPWSLQECRQVGEALEQVARPLELLAICTLESDLRIQVKAEHAGGEVDVGICGVRCARGKHGRCSNWPVRGLTPRTLMHPERNIRAAERLLERKRERAGARYLLAYNGASRPNRYPERVRCLEAVFRGDTCKPRGRRMRRLVRLLAPLRGRLPGRKTMQENLFGKKELRHVLAPLPGKAPTAVWSKDDAKIYRYRLGWPILDSPFKTPRRVLWVMLNPSTADEFKLDPTLNRVRSFSRDQAYATWFEVVNLFAFRATNPEELRKSSDPVGPENDLHIAAAAREADQIWVGWGANAFAEQRARHVMLMLREITREPIWCLGLTQGGEPRHPLYVEAKQQRQEYRPLERSDDERRLKWKEE